MPQVPETEPTKIIRPNRFRCMLRGCPLCHPERPCEVSVDDLLELLLGHPHEERVRGDAGIGHQHFNRTLVLLDLLERAVDGLGVRHVAFHAEEPVRGAGPAVG